LEKKEAELRQVSPKISYAPKGILFNTWYIIKSSRLMIEKPKQEKKETNKEFVLR
jgi:hypothetical protein